MATAADNLDPAAAEADSWSQTAPELEDLKARFPDRAAELDAAHRDWVDAEADYSDAGPGARYAANHAAVDAYEAFRDLEDELLQAEAEP